MTTATSTSLEPLEPGLYREIVRRALAEDFGWGDVTTEGVVDRDRKARGVLLAKSRCVIAGLEVASEAFRQMDPAVAVTAHRADGDWCEPMTVVAEYRGYAAAMLTAERTALNFVQRLSGIATLTRQFVEAAAGRIVILDTRKTTPLLRALEKYAVRAGGGANHRSGLDDGILIKDNHIRLAGGVAAAVTRMRKANREMPTEVEVERLEDVDEALGAGADIVLLDNLSTADIIEAVERCRGVAKTEISGGVTLARIRELAATGADSVSIGGLTHSAPAVDLSFEIEPV
ncbi:MAG: nicotinate-nucleotide diphosphorylase (carboxylating) [Acidobacteria bacterium RIFCSPLOWO2_02_FULL_68_18]|nr:MAG: nicotinate-nucleotide diphosphorylase (carboxylating) [Acidobacteria bacterium RIFCSPLOWO2_02_FULL_68_18]OFW50337.1 MAG: nicotinate-nucleotide diphosphorylase (carboxylating) [Acidobacteria bacterium RIFCSPLOWO2_12_FULL_68_19]